MVVQVERFDTSIFDVNRIYVESEDTLILGFDNQTQFFKIAYELSKRDHCVEIVETNKMRVTFARDTNISIHFYVKE